MSPKEESVRALMDEYFIERIDAERLSRRIERIERTPVEVSKRINQEVSLLFPVRYSATPERISGLFHIVQESAYRADGITPGNNPDSPQYRPGYEPRVILIRHSPPLKLTDYEIDFDNTKPSVLYKLLSPPFFSINMTESFHKGLEFPDVVWAHYRNLINSALEQVEGSTNKHERNRFHNCREWKINFLEGLETDWEDEMSMARYNQRQQNRIKSVKRNIIKPEAVYTRMENEGLLDSREHQLKLLYGWFEIQEFVNYTEALESIEEKLRSAMKSLTRSVKDPNLGYFKKDNEARVASYKFIRDLLDKHRESVVGYLGR